MHNKAVLCLMTYNEQYLLVQNAEHAIWEMGLFETEMLNKKKRRKQSVNKVILKGYASYIKEFDKVSRFSLHCENQFLPITVFDKRLLPFEGNLVEITGRITYNYDKEKKQANWSIIAETLRILPIKPKEADTTPNNASQTHNNYSKEYSEEEKEYLKDYLGDAVDWD